MITTKPKIGCRDLVYALLTESSDVAGGTPAYGTIKALATLGKIGVNPNSSLATLFGDDKQAAVAETVGKIDVDFELADISPEAYAELLGHTYSGGAIVEKSSDSSPWIALGFKITRAGTDAGAAVYEYFWLYKGKMAKPTDNSETKKDAINFQSVALKGNFAALMANDAWRLRVRTDDPAASATLITNFFTQVTLVAADASALSCVIAQGSAGNIGKVMLTFTKVSGLSFNIAASSLANLTGFFAVNETDDDDAFLAGTFSTPVAGTSVVVYFTPTTAITATDEVVAMVNANIIDDSGVHCTAAVKHIASWAA